MKKLTKTLMAVSLLAAFSAPAFASEDRVNTDASFCLEERTAGKDIQTSSNSSEAKSQASSVTQD